MMNKIQFYLRLSVILLAIGLVFAGCDLSVDEPPDLTGTVTIDNNSPKVGDTLTAAYDGNGTGAASWQWYRGNDPISDEITNAYTVAAADVGSSLKAQVSYQDQKGVAVSAATNAVAAAEVAAKPVLTGTVTINNTSPKVGDTLTATYEGDGSETITWRWISGSEIISGATRRTYTVITADIDKTLMVFVSSENYMGMISSARTNKVVAK